MTKQQVLNNIANDKQFYKSIKLVVGNDKGQYKDDLYQDVFIMLAGKSEEQLVKLWETKQIYAYHYQMARYAYREKKSNINKLNYSIEQFDLKDTDEDLDQLDNEFQIEKEKNFEEKVLEVFEEEYWFDQEILKLTIDQTRKQIAKATKISEPTIDKSLQQIRNSIKEKVNINKQKKHIW